MKKNTIAPLQSKLTAAINKVLKQNKYGINDRLKKSIKKSVKRIVRRTDTDNKSSKT
jgi:hypothetical protein